MTLDNFVEKYKGKFVDFDGAYGAQCTDLYRQYVKEVLGFPQSPGVVGAADIWTSYLPDYFDKVPNTPEGIPQSGDIVIWNRRYGAYGHVAIVIKADINTMTCFSQNDPIGQPCIIKQYSYKNIYGWLHPKVSNMADDKALEACMKDRQQFWDQRDSLIRELQAESTEGAIAAIRGLRSRITDLGNQVGSLQAEVKNREEQVGRLKNRVIENDMEIEALRINLKEAQNSTDRMAQDKGALQIEVEQLKTQLASAKQGEIVLTFKEIITALLNNSIKISKK